MTQLSHGGQLCDECQSICTTNSVYRALVIGGYAYIRYVMVEYIPCTPIIITFLYIFNKVLLSNNQSILHLVILLHYIQVHVLPNIDFSIILQSVKTMGFLLPQICLKLKSCKLWHLITHQIVL